MNIQNPDSEKLFTFSCWAGFDACNYHKHRINSQMLVFLLLASLHVYDYSFIISYEVDDMYKHIRDYVVSRKSQSLSTSEFVLGISPCEFALSFPSCEIRFFFSPSKLNSTRKIFKLQIKMYDWKPSNMKSIDLTHKWTWWESRTSRQRMMEVKTRMFEKCEGVDKVGSCKMVMLSELRQNQSYFWA